MRGAGRWRAGLVTRRRVTDLDEPSVVSGRASRGDAHLLVAEQNRLRWRHALTREVVAADGAAAGKVISRRTRGAGSAGPRRRGRRVGCGRSLGRGRRARRGSGESGCAKSDATSPRVRCAAPGSGWTNWQRTGALPVQVAIERVRLYTTDRRRQAARSRWAPQRSTAQPERITRNCACYSPEPRSWPDAGVRPKTMFGGPAGQMTRDPLYCSLRRRTEPDGSTRPSITRTVPSSGREAGPTSRGAVRGAVHRRSAGRLRDPAASAAAFRRASQVAAEFGLRPWRVEAEFGLGTAESLEQEWSARISSARDLALDSGLLMQAGGAEIILAEQAYVTQGPRALKAPAQRVLDLGDALQSAYLLGLGDLLLAQSNAVPGQRAADGGRSGVRRGKGRESAGHPRPDLGSPGSATALEPRPARCASAAGPLRRRVGRPRSSGPAASVWVVGASPHDSWRGRCRGADHSGPSARWPAPRQSRGAPTMRRRLPMAAKAIGIAPQRHSRRLSRTCRRCRTGIGCCDCSPPSARSTTAGAIRWPTQN